MNDVATDDVIVNDIAQASSSMIGPKYVAQNVTLSNSTNNPIDDVNMEQTNDNLSSTVDSNKVSSLGTRPSSVPTPISSLSSTNNLPTQVSTSTADIIELSRSVPLRLTPDERALLTVLEQTLHVSEYTDNVDVTMYNGGAGMYGGSSSSYNAYRKYNGSTYNSSSTAPATSLKTQKIIDNILEVCHIATGLATSSGNERKLMNLCYPSNNGNDGQTSSSSTMKKSSSYSGGISMITSFLKSSSKSKKSAKRDKQLQKEEKKKLKLLKRGKKLKHKVDDIVMSDAGEDSTLKVTEQGTTKGSEVILSNKTNQVPLQAVGEQLQDHSSTNTSEVSQGEPTSNINETSRNATTSPTSKAPTYVPWACRTPADNAILYQTMFEIGRRNKILNPSSMRTTYGKLMYILQDSQNPVVQRTLGFSLHKDIQLVYTYCEYNNCVDLLYDKKLTTAIQYISDRDMRTGEKYDRQAVSKMIQTKKDAMEELILSYSTQPNDHQMRKSKLTPDEVRRIIESLADAVVYLESNVRPVQRMLRYLKRNFSPSIEHGTNGSPHSSLSLRSSSRTNYSSSNSNSYYSSYGYSAYSSRNDGGPTLSHNHLEQYTFVEQSLSLWCKVQRNMHRLWVCADDDLLSTACTYHLYNTGQGLNRVQACPKVRKLMSSLLHQTQQESGKGWVGLSVIHLGDRDVPNALIFIDKYTQIPRFLNPIVNFLDDIPTIATKDERVRNYIQEQFKTIEDLKMNVLQDYFKHGFDGSGDDGGSCIDGRLTSSWNWTSRLAKKKYYNVFMLSGFQGFDGEFR